VQNHCIIPGKNVTFIGGFAPLTPTRGSAPGPRWRPTAAPDPCLFFPRPCHPLPPEIPGSAPAIVQKFLYHSEMLPPVFRRVNYFVLNDQVHNHNVRNKKTYIFTAVAQLLDRETIGLKLPLYGTICHHCSKNILLLVSLNGD
jgi:hypothetical protein